mgnify:CR=1 FL=1
MNTCIQLYSGVGYGHNYKVHINTYQSIKMAYNFLGGEKDV